MALVYPEMIEQASDRVGMSLHGMWECRGPIAVTKPQQIDQHRPIASELGITHDEGEISRRGGTEPVEVDAGWSLSGQVVITKVCVKLGNVEGLHDHLLDTAALAEGAANWRHPTVFADLARIADSTRGFVDARHVRENDLVETPCCPHLSYTTINSPSSSARRPLGVLPACDRIASFSTMDAGLLPR